MKLLGESDAGGREGGCQSLATQLAAKWTLPRKLFAALKSLRLLITEELNDPPKGVLRDFPPCSVDGQLRTARRRGEFQGKTSILDSRVEERNLWVDLGFPSARALRLEAFCKFSRFESAVCRATPVDRRSLTPSNSALTALCGLSEGPDILSSQSGRTPEMAGDEEGRRTRLMELLTAKSALPPDLTRRPERGAVSFSEAKLPGLETRLLHLQALRRHLADSERLPFHRFWPLRFPFVLDSALLKPNAASSVRRIPEAVDVFRDRLARRKRVALAETFDALSAQSGSSDSACQVQIPVQWAAFLEKQHSLSPAEELRVILIQLVLLGSFVWAPVLLFYVWRRFCTSRRRKVLFLIGLALLFAFPRRPRPGVRLWPGWRQIHKYHRTAAIVEKPEALPPNHPTIFAVVPHGVFPIAPVSKGKPTQPLRQSDS